MPTLGVGMCSRDGERTPYFSSETMSEVSDTKRRGSGRLDVQRPRSIKHVISAMEALDPRNTRGLHVGGRKHIIGVLALPKPVAAGHDCVSVERHP